ncbi:Protein of unknown function [Flavobacterium frigidimaris]|nr:Protein of unknown function [Flavobacterium frigidimaris]
MNNMEKSGTKDPKKKSKITAEQKKTYIAYAVIGVFALGLIIYAVSDFDSDDKNKQVEEFGTPEGEANKYNSKIEALNGGKEQDTTINGDLMGFSTNEPLTVPETNIKKAPNKTIEEEKPVENISTTETKKQSSGGSVKRKSTAVKKTQPKEYYTNSEEAPVQQPTVVAQQTSTPKQVNANSISNFFSSSKKKEIVKQDVIYAVIKGDQMGIKNNQRVTLLLPKDVTIDDKLFKKNTIVYAKATFSGSRVNFTVTSINQNPVQLMGYDAQDGGLGLQVTESLIGETTSGVIDQNANDSGLDDIPVVGRTLNNILRKKNKEVKIDLLNNQKMILKPSSR